MYIILAILAFSILIVGHELGHFTLAKINGIKVEEFSLGMGPKIIGIKGKETEYLIKALPIGGYVKMLGEEESTSDHRAFSNKSPLRRISVIAAGPIMNFILAIILFAIISLNNGFVVNKISEIIDNSPAQKVGLKAGDEITKVNNKKITTWEDFTTEIYASNGNSLSLEINREGKKQNISITPEKSAEDNRYIIGIRPSKVESPSIGESIKYGFNESISLIKQTFVALKTLFSGKASINDVGGPVTIIKATGTAAKAGIWNLMWFSAYLSVQLAVFNLLPFPALDGGWILLLFIEFISRRKISDKIVATLNYIGFSLLIGLMIIVTIKDILFPIKF